MTPDDMEEVVSEWLSLVETFTPHNYSRVRHVPVCQGEVSAIRALLLAYQERGRALEWYGEQARLARLIHSEGDAGRRALTDDGGKRARAALTGEDK